MNNLKTWNDLCWYLVQTHSRQEDRAESNLRSFGIETLAPRLKDRRDSVQDKKGIRSRKSACRKALLHKSQRVAELDKNASSRAVGFGEGFDTPPFGFRYLIVDKGWGLNGN
jgi:hypothetical protein